jgi:hypothetical protein
VASPKNSRQDLLFLLLAATLWTPDPRRDMSKSQQEV